MNDYFVDLHIHIGRTSSGRPVKITGSKELTLENIIIEARENKGMDIIGIIDCHAPEVLHDLEKLIEQGKIIKEADGTLHWEALVILLGVEIEINDTYSHGPFHVLAYVPTIEAMRELSSWLAQRMKNINLSTQRFYGAAVTVQEKIKELHGLFIPAHIFTPFKSLYGVGVKRSLTEVLDPTLIDAVELGLSSNTMMADQLLELHQYPYVSNSDAHSVRKIAREYQVIRAKKATFQELKLALKQKEGRKIIANYGLDPLLGKYYRSTCEKCHFPIQDERDCPQCGHNRIIKGVYERLLELKDANKSANKRPPYIHQVPLEYIPKLGPKTLEKLRRHFGTEMNILHSISQQQLEQVIHPSLAEKIIQARAGRLTLSPGGGGKYGKVTER